LKICRFKEGESLKIEETLKRCSADISSEELRKALIDLEDSIQRFKRCFFNESRRLFGFRIRLEAPAPRIRGETIYTGFWSGIYEYTPHEDREPIYIVIEPRVKGYYEMLRDIQETLHSYRDFQLLIEIAPATHPSIIALEFIKKLLYEVQNLIDREPKYIATKISDSSGEYVEVLMGARDIELKPYTIRKTLNESLAFATAIALKNAAKAIQSIRCIAKEVERLTGESTILKAVEEYINQMSAFLELLLSEEFVAYSLYKLDTVDFERIDLERYWHVLYTSRLVSLVVRGAREASGSLRISMLPSTKIYELFVYANIVKQFGDRVEEVKRSRLALRIGSAKLYFNHYSRSISRFIRSLTKRTPAPDIFYTSKSLSAPIECKYRKLNGQKLMLRDAERLLSYIVDASKDEDLIAIIASLSKPVESEVKANINGKNIRIVFAEFNPDTKIESIAPILRP
jgi:hypothetical protein